MRSACLMLLFAFAVPAAASEEKYPTGFNDTPIIPGTKWHVHDGDRPHAPVVKPGDQPGQPPSDAIVLFDGRNLDAWESSKGGGARWKVQDGYAEVVPDSGDIVTKRKFGDYQLHLEFREPSPPTGKSQERGNSGVYLAGLYEVQILDSYDNVTYADGQASAIFGQTPPLANASRPPGEWQSYDIVFETPRFAADGKVVSPGYVTVLHNGVLTQNHTALLGPATFHALPTWKPHGGEMPLKLQDHEMLVRFRNIWLRPLADR